MTYFAKVVDGVVTNVIAADQDFIDNLLEDTPSRWIETLNFPIYLGGPIGEYFGKPILEFIWKQNLNNLKEIFEK